uniref:Cadherin domain-containing protein n=1 Tax=Ditylenchus dipsaci TaxID=166011 RepID=A0A915DB92_9BILA
MDASTGDLILEKVLPHGSFQNFTMVVSAKVGGKENFAMVHFHPKLSNKHAPTFVFDQYQFYLDNDWKTENPVGWVQAFDPDVKDYGRVGYSIVSGNENGLFTINSTTGELRLGNKDLPSNFTGALLAIRAHDFAPLHRSTTCTVRIYSVKEGAKSISNQQIQLTR